MPELEITLNLLDSKTENIFIGTKKEVKIKAYKKEKQDCFILKQFTLTGKQKRVVVDKHEIMFNTDSFGFLILEYNGLDFIRFEISYS